MNRKYKISTEKKVEKSKEFTKEDLEIINLLRLKLNKLIEKEADAKKLALIIEEMLKKK